MSQPSAALAKAMASNKRGAAPPDKLSSLQAKAAEARDLELEINDLAARLAEKKNRLRALYDSELPDMLDEIGLDHVGVPPRGNSPGVDYRLRPYYRASIAAAWTPAKRQEAFDLLKKLGAEDLIKTEMTLRLPRGNVALAKRFIALAKKELKVSTELKQSVHSGTLTAWLRETYERKKQALPTSQLELLGASVGRTVTADDRRGE